MYKKLLELFFKQFGRKPNKLERLQLKFKAAQQAGKGKVVEFPPSAITDWRKPRPTEAEIQQQNMEKMREFIIKNQSSKTKIPLPGSEEAIKRKLIEQNKKSIKRLKDKMKDPEDLASGGLAGMLGEPTYQDDNHRVPFKDAKSVEGPYIPPKNFYDIGFGSIFSIISFLSFCFDLIINLSIFFFLIYTFFLNDFFFLINTFFFIGFSIILSHNLGFLINTFFFIGSHNFGFFFLL